MGKKIRGKVTNFFASDLIFFPDEIFPRLSFSRPAFFPDFFSPDKEFIPIFLISNYYYYFPFICKVYKNFEIRVKARNWKNNCNNINTTRNCTFVHFKNYATLKTSKRIGFKLVLIISRSKERVFNSFKDFVWFFNRLCYLRWLKAIQNQITAPLQILVHLIDPFYV